MTDETKKARILVVDDDPQLLELLTETLEAIGYRVSAAPGGLEAMQRISEETFDLIITDVKMPDVDGLQLYRKVKRHHPEMPILFITGVASRETLGSVTPDGFLAKPFRIGHIEGLIEDALSRPAQDIPEHRSRVLIIDVDEKRRQRIAEALASGGFLPFAASTHQEAERELESGKFDAVIADTEMSDEKGPAWINRLKIDYPEISVILSGPDSKPPPKKTLKRGFDGYLSRPFANDDLISMLSRLAPSEPGTD
ncbi:MAG: response regulator [Candidatus Zixiibacteriota bacterium]